MALHLDVAIDAGWHLYGPNPQHDFLMPTTITLVDSPHAVAGTVVAPEAATINDPQLGEPVAVYTDHIRSTLPVTIATDAPVGPLELRLRLQSQACDASRCLLPRSDMLSFPVILDATATGP